MILYPNVFDVFLFSCFRYLRLQMDTYSIVLLLFCCWCCINADLPTERCPDGCVCVKRDVKCYALTDFPTSFPPLTTYIFMDEMNIQTIPPDSFHGLAFLNTVEFQRSNFGSIPSCAFKTIQSLEKIIFFKCVIGHLDKFAIYNISSPLTIDIKKSKITKMDSFAVMSIPYMVSFNLQDTTIYEMKTMAFVNVTAADFLITGCDLKKIHRKPFMFTKLRTVEITGNTFETLPCGTFENLLTASSDVIPTFMENGVQCDCGIGYLKRIADSEVKNILGSMYCVEEKKINKNKTVSEALEGTLLCTQKSKIDFTNCRTEDSLTVPALTCPSHSHGHGGYNPSGKKHDDRNSANVGRAMSFLLTLSFIIML